MPDGMDEIVKKVTTREIGKKVGVSAVTVSRALAGKPGMSDAVRERILRAAEEMGYEWPDRETGTPAHLDIGILIPEAFFHANSFYTNFYKYLVQRLTEAGHYAMLELVKREDEDGLRLPLMLENQRVKGMILMGQTRKDYSRMIAGQGMPLVFLDYYDEQANADAVVGDNTYGSYRLTSHLIKNGHSHIGFVGNYRATSSIMDRYLGFCRALLSHDLPVRMDWVLMDRDLNNVLKEKIPLPEEMPTAFVCNCDLVARKLIDQLTAVGYRVPEDISVTGYDDFELETGRGPGISTFRVDMGAMAEIAVKMLLDRCAGLRKPFGRTIIGGHPVYRESEGPAPR